MEYPAKNDFFLKFKGLFNDKGEFIDYILIDISDNFRNISKVKPEYLIGKRLSVLYMENVNEIIGIKDFYYYMIPNAMRKFEKYMEELDLWYLINITSDESEYLLLFYTEVSALFKTVESRKIS